MKVTSRSSVDDDEEDDSTEEEETEDSKSKWFSFSANVLNLNLSFLVKRLEFEKRRKAHYNEFEAVRQARKLMAKEDGGDGDEDDDNVENDDNVGVAGTGGDNKMDVDDQPRQSTSREGAATDSCPSSTETENTTAANTLANTTSHV